MAFPAKTTVLEL